MSKYSTITPLWDVSVLDNLNVMRNPQMFKNKNGYDDNNVKLDNTSDTSSVSMGRPRLDPRWKVNYHAGTPYTAETAPICDVVVGSKMMTFDKLKMVLRYYTIPPFLVLNEKAFTCEHKQNGQACYTYKDKDINLFIRYGKTRLNCKYNELIVEITSTILQERKMELISNNNIRDCLKMLAEKYKLIQIIDIEYFIQNAYVMRCDVTIDKCLDTDMAKKFYEYTYNNRKNIRTSDMDTYEDVNFTLQNNVKNGSANKIRLEFYDKELQLKSIAGKLSSVIDPKQYKDMYRLEFNLINPKQIKEYLSIKSNLLSDVLWSEAQPILKAYEKFVLFQSDMKPLIREKKTYVDNLIAKDCRYDITLIENQLRKFHKPWLKKYLAPYREICTLHALLESQMQELIHETKKILTIPYEKHIIYAKA